MKHLLSNSVLSLLIVGTGLSTTLFLIRVLDIVEYGHYEYLLGTVGVFSIIFNLGADAHGSKLLHDASDEKGLISFLLLVRLLLFTLVVFVACVFSLEVGFAILALNIGSLGFSFIFEHRAILHQYNLTLLFERLSFFVILFLSETINPGAVSLNVVLLVFFGVSFIGFIIQVRLIEFRARFDIKSTRLLFRSLSRGLVLLMLTQLVDFFNTGLSKYFLKGMLGLKSVALFALLMKFSLISNVLTSQGIKLFRPGIFRNQLKDLRFYLLYVVGGLSIVAIVLFVFKQFLLSFLPRSYEGIDEALPITLLYLPMIPLLVLAQTLMQRSNLLQLNFTYSLIGLALKIFLVNFILVSTLARFVLILLVVDVTIVMSKLITANYLEKASSSKFSI